MANLVYQFTFPSRALGLDVEVTDKDGQAVSVTSPTLELTDDSGNAYIQVALDAADAPYSGSVSSARRGVFAYSAQGSVALDASIASGGGVGASETAYFVATGPVYATDGNGAAGNLTFVADDRHGALPSWASINAGDIELTSDAGTCAFAVTAAADFDFASASGTPDTPDTIGTGGVLATLDGNQVANVSDAGTVADGQTTQTSDAVRGGGLLIGTSLTVGIFPLVDGVADGTATPRVALTITRIAQAAVLPE